MILREEEPGLSAIKALKRLARITRKAERPADEPEDRDLLRRVLRAAS